jgi:hypothetical protein
MPQVVEVDQGDTGAVAQGLKVGGVEGLRVYSRGSRLRHSAENGRRDQVPHAVGGPWRLFLLLEPMLILPPAR